LAGLTLPGGWVVERFLERPPQSTGGFFSVGYIVKGAADEEAFLKALDLTSVVDAPDLPRALEALAAAYNFERDLLQKCRVRRLTRIATPIADGSLDVPGYDLPFSRVNYLIFELARGDVRTHLDAAEAFDLALRLRALHHVATGLQQLHGQGIAHQDLKPSNVLVFDDYESKIGDLGRAADRLVPVPHDDLVFAGDLGYAPPELLYGYVLPDWAARRFGCDAYLLGSLIVFFFCRVSMTAGLIAHVDPAHHPKRWGDGFEAVLPYLRAASDIVIQQFQDEAVLQAPALAGDLTEMVRQLCEPDPRLRGHPSSRGNLTTQYDLYRFITRLDLLSRRAELGRSKP